MTSLPVNKCHPRSWFKPGRVIRVDNKMEVGEYTLTASYGRLDPSFKPELTPAQMLRMGVFEGKYLNDMINEFPREWFPAATLAKLSPERANPELNYYSIKSRQSLQEWRRKKWILPDDCNPRGWFEWYCRYYIGRRIPEHDEKQIKRHRAFVRHLAQVKKGCKTNCKGDCKKDCRPKQRQALIQWAYDARKV